MANDDKNSSGAPRHLDEVKGLLDLMKKHDLCEVEIEEQGRRIRLKKAEKSGPVRPEPLIERAPSPAHTPQGPAPAAQTLLPATSQEGSPIRLIESPMVGTFYQANGPDTAPYISVGDDVAPGKVLCIIEAMKVMNEIKSEVTGEIVEILARNGEPVEYGQPLFKVNLRKG